MPALQARHVMTKRFGIVDAEESLELAKSALSDETEVLFVMEEGGAVGALTERAILRSGLERASHTVRDLMIGTPVVRGSTPVLDCVRLMTENDLLKIPVVDGGETIGVVTAENVMRSLAGRKRFREMMVGEVMSSPLVVCGPDDPVRHILNLFKTHLISRVPVVKGGRIVGVVTMHDLVIRAFLSDNRPELLQFGGDMKQAMHALPVWQVMSTAVEITQADKKVSDILEKVAREGAVIVVDSSWLPLGIVTVRDILELILNEEETQKRWAIHLSSKVDNVDRRGLLDELGMLAERYQKTLESGHLYAYLTEVGHGKKDSLQCRLKLHLPGRILMVKAASSSPAGAVNEAIEKLDRKLRKYKEFTTKERLRQSIPVGMLF